MVIGLTGYPGAGKSEVARILAERGAMLIEADLIGHRVLEIDTVRRHVVSLAAPHNILGPDKQIDRKLLAEVVFPRRQLLTKLEAIIYPEVKRRIGALLEANRDKVVVIEAALLFHADLHLLCDEVIIVDAPLEQQLERVKDRGWSRRDLQLRQQSQHSQLAKHQYLATILIHNNASLDDLAGQVNDKVHF